MLLAVGGLLLAAAGGVMAAGCSDDGAFDWRARQPWRLPPFVMELETFSLGAPESTIVLTWVSEDDWLWEVFNTDGSLRSWRRLESGRLTPNGTPEAAEPGVNYWPPAPDWLISPATAVGRRARQLPGLAAFEREVVFTCGPDDQRCAPGETLRITQRIDYDAATAIPIAYTEAHNGVVVRTVRAVRLSVD